MNEILVRHKVRKEHNPESGWGIDSAHRMVCSCGWQGPWRAEHDDLKYTHLLQDEYQHENDVRNNLTR